MRLSAVAVVALASCRPPAAPRVEVAAGRAVTVYVDPAGDLPGQALVDDRRWLDVPADGWIWFDEIAAALELDSVVLTSATAPGTLAVAACRRGGGDAGLVRGRALLGRRVEATLIDGAVVAGEVVATADDGQRDRPGATAAVAPGQLTIATDATGRVEVRLAQIAAIRMLEVGATGLGCHVVSERPGRQLVRLSYASPGARWTVAYQVDVPPGEGAVEVPVARRFTVAAPGLFWRGPLELTLAVGMPGQGTPPRVAWQGEARLDGQPVTVQGPREPRAGTVAWVYRGAVDVTGKASDDVWGAASGTQVVRELQVPIAAADLAGPVSVTGPAGAGANLPTRPAAGGVGSVRLPLATAIELVGYRRRRVLVRDGAYLADELVYSVANNGAQPATVIVDEPLRSSAVSIRFARPERAGQVTGSRWQRQVVVPAGGMVQGAVVFEYRRLR